jgi:hypothetical protein
VAVTTAFPEVGVGGREPQATLNVTGCINGLTTTTGCNGSNNVTLLGDDFQSVSTVPLGGSNFDVVFGQLQGTLNPKVASFFGLSVNGGEGGGHFRGASRGHAANAQWR